MHGNVAKTHPTFEFVSKFDIDPTAFRQQHKCIARTLWHASHYLKLQESAKKRLLIITDGKPADVDIHDPQYLRQDTKKAVEETGRAGILTYCISLDPRADQYVSRIFGERNY